MTISTPWMSGSPGRTRRSSLRRLGRSLNSSLVPIPDRSRCSSTDNPLGLRRCSNEDAIVCLACAIPFEPNDEWAVKCVRYMTLKTIAPVSDDPICPASAGELGAPPRHGIRSRHRPMVDCPSLYLTIMVQQSPSGTLAVVQLRLAGCRRGCVCLRSPTAKTISRFTIPCVRFQWGHRLDRERNNLGPRFEIRTVRRSLRH